MNLPAPAAPPPEYFETGGARMERRYVLALLVEVVVLVGLWALSRSFGS